MSKWVQADVEEANEVRSGASLTRERVISDDELTLDRDVAHRVRRLGRLWMDGLLPAVFQ